MREIAEELRQWRAAGDAVAIATVVETWGSSPRPLGSKMLASSSGKMAGSVSNGCIEGDVFEAAQEVLASGRPRLVEYGVADDVAFGVGLACGGHIEVMIQPAGEIHDRALDLLAAERPFVLRTDLQSGASELLEQAPDFELARRDGETFWEPFGRPANMVIIGAIHIAIPLHRMAKLMGYRVTIVDARGQFATRERFPEADRILVQWPDEALAGLTVDRSTAVVILTHDPKFDMPALRSVLRTDAGYVGAIGSRKTNQNRFEALRKEGFEDAQLDRVHGPIGLDLGARGAEETALGIMAEVTAVRYGGTVLPMREKRRQAVSPAS
ncbi:MAG: XdhC/CoxI family protein [Candidatus Nephthysia bennettiae]|uniref:XdhC family protein n=1 Tax=Candidatus Nephthysia bennettiae TaxID=3127016 RepID=A0A934K2K5_9BACT|nr:XdhC family protein [Candidatus Dormibacteraeota bacterium]MBJ7612200.1 XdhC family protein [Candidatus Dormibacteraeota bacterium]PZR93608.1 MAG: XdhC/CoxI family protein [Candidatus Dormibacteraeota bacterium]